MTELFAKRPFWQNGKQKSSVFQCKNLGASLRQPLLWLYALSKTSSHHWSCLTKKRFVQSRWTKRLKKLIRWFGFILPNNERDVKVSGVFQAYFEQIVDVGCKSFHYVLIRVKNQVLGWKMRVSNAFNFYRSIRARNKHASSETFKDLIHKWILPSFFFWPVKI